MFEGIIYIFVVGLIFQYLWSRRKLYVLSTKLPGPPALPLIGNGLMFNCKSEDIYDVLVKMMRQYGPVMKYWLGPELVVVMYKLPYVEVILSSTKITYKGNLYKFLADLGGVGLITSSGPKWREHRKLIQPMINLKYINSQIIIIQKHLKKLITLMEKYADNGIIDIFNLIHPCCFDIIGEAICGIETNTQEGNNLQVFRHFEEFYNNVFTQMLKPWLHLSAFFNLTHYKTERDIIRKNTKDFFNEIFNISRRRIQQDNDLVTDESPIIDKITLYLSKNPNFMNDQELYEHMITLYSASEDTASLIVSSLCLCFGMYPEYQEIAANEVRNVLGETPRMITTEDISKLKYLEMCIKETLRLFPIAPFIMRRCTEELIVGEYRIPLGCEVTIPIDLIHKDPEQWTRPNDFYPYHFLPDNVKNRHPYSFLPFSAGPRVCIGKYLAMHMLKVMSAVILQKYSFKAEGKYSDLKFKSDISIRVKSGYQVKMSKRVW